MEKPEGCSETQKAYARAGTSWWYWVGREGAWSLGVENQVVKDVSGS